MFSRFKILIFLSFSLLTISCRNSTHTLSEDLPVPIDNRVTAKPDTTVFMYGIPSDSFDLIAGQIKRNGFLSTILLENGIIMQ